MSKYRVEMIPKKSVIDDIIGYWEASGRPAGLENGQIVFESVEYAEARTEVIFIRSGDNCFYYNTADFYRVKVTILEAAE